MKPQSPKKSTRNSLASPKKSISHNYQDDIINQLQDENQQLQFQLGERDIEIDRMKTTLFALNEKLAMVTDIRNDLDETKSYLQGSESTRQELQGHIQDTSEKVK